MWNQIQADIYGVPVRTLRVTDATILGAAILGGVGAGEFPTVADGAEQMVNVERLYEPDADRASLYDRLYETFCSAYAALTDADIFSRLTRLQQ